MASAPYYELIADYVDDKGSVPIISVSPHWIMVVVRLGMPLSFSHTTLKSTTTDVSQGAKLRGDNLVITSDCLAMQVGGSKSQHTKSFSAELKQSDHNYLVEILPGDWVLGWMVNDAETFKSLLDRIAKLGPCNGFNDGFKFVGRVDTVRKVVSLDRGSGIKTASYTVSAIGFRELDSQFFYDFALADGDQSVQNLGDWLAHLGINAEELWATNAQRKLKSNAGYMIRRLIDLIVGEGLGPNINQPQNANNQINNGNNGNLQQAQGAGATSAGSAPFAYLVPRVVGKLLGKATDSSNKPGSLMGYADLLDTLIGIQNYSNSGGSGKPEAVLMPDLDSSSNDGRLTTPTPLLGTFYPERPQFANHALWSMLQQYLNPAINEIYTALRVNNRGKVVPTIVVRQIPFTTEAFQSTQNQPDAGAAGPAGPSIEVTRFLSLPRWRLHDTMLDTIDLGRSDATRVNFVHIYGQSADTTGGGNLPQQIAQNAPIRDDLDIQRSGLRSYMTTVACAIDDTVGKTPSTWMALVADRTVGSQFTLNGTIGSIGIQAPICEGDNTELDGVVYHLESVFHRCGISPDGSKSFTTTLMVSNGMRATGDKDQGTGSSGSSGQGNDKDLPIYPGLSINDNIGYDPGRGGADLNASSKSTVDAADLSVPPPPGSSPAPQAGGTQPAQSEYSDTGALPGGQSVLDVKLLGD